MISHIYRYADIVVHRLLACAIGADMVYPDLLDKHKLQVRFFRLISLFNPISSHILIRYMSGYVVYEH